MKFKILISLLAVIAVAGCTIPGIPGITPGTLIGGGQGLEIISFTVEPDTVYNGSTVKVSMDVQNLGGTTAFNDTSFAYLANIDVTSSDNNVWHRIDSDTTTTECIRFGRDMKPADAVKGTSGDEKTIKWALRAPDVTSGQSVSSSFMGRVYTDYETAVNGNIWIYSETEYDAAKSSNRALNKATFTPTSGPVAVVVSVSPDPFIVYGSDNQLTLNIKISNNGAGSIYKPGKSSVCPPTVSSDDLNEVSVTIRAPNFGISSDCQTGETNTTTQSLMSGKPTTVTCTLSAPTVTTLQSYPINVKVDYGYYTEKTATVTVQGK